MLSLEFPQLFLMISHIVTYLYFMEVTESKKPLGWVERLFGVLETHIYFYLMSQCMRFPTMWYVRPGSAVAQW